MLALVESLLQFFATNNKVQLILTSRDYQEQLATLSLGGEELQIMLHNITSQAKRRKGNSRSNYLLRLTLTSGFHTSK